MKIHFYADGMGVSVRTVKNPYTKQIEVEAIFVDIDTRTNMYTVLGDEGHCEASKEYVLNDTKCANKKQVEIMKQKMSIYEYIITEI